MKKSANLHVFESIKKEFDSHLSKQQESETERREEPASSKVQKKEKSIDTSIVKLRAKYKWIKDKWRQYTDRVKSGSGKAAMNEPEWFHIINPIFSETNAKLKVATKASDLLSSENEEDSAGETGDELSDERVDETHESDLLRNQQRSSSFQSNMSYDGATSESLLSRSSDEEDQTDQTDGRYWVII